MLATHSRWSRITRRSALVVTALVTGACGPSGPAAEVADVVLRGGKIVTMDDARPEAQAIAIRGDRILAVGSDEEIAAHIGDATEVIDIAGQTAVPGFIEGHGHYMSLGRAKMILDLTKARSWNDIVAMVGEAARTARPGQWIEGRGWHQEKWDQIPTPSVEGNPVHADLSRVSPDHPVVLGHASGHASFVNAKAMELAGIGRETPNPAGGEIVRDAQGNPTGLLRETAQRLTGEALAKYQASRAPEEVQAERRKMAQLAGEDALSKGVTSFHDAGAPFETIDFYKQLADEGQLPIRIYAMVRRESNDVMREKLPQYRMVGYGNGFLTVRSIKRQIDGALGAHGAWLLEPYADLPRSAGLNLEPLEEIEETARIALEHGYQVNTHAIGDRGNREVLDIYEKVFRANPEKKDLRWRIEHAQHLDPADIARFKELGVIASMQGIHATSDGPWVPAKLGEKRAEEGAYVWRKLLDAGVVITNGTDVPVEDIDPIASYYATVSRKLKDGSIFYPAQRMTREEALRSYTLNNAYAAFEEAEKGSLSPGKLADITVLSKDIMTVAEDEIPSTRVVLTMVGGKVKYRAQGQNERGTT